MRGKCKNIDCTRLHERANGVPPPECRTPRRSRSPSLSSSLPGSPVSRMEHMRDSTQEALKKTSEELKQRLLGSRLRQQQQAQQRESELKATEKRMPRRKKALESAPAHVCPADRAIAEVWDFWPEEAGLGSFGSSGSSGSSDRIANTLPHHNRQHSRSRCPARNLVGTCPICLERPQNHCLVPCGHRVCLQCGLSCLPICPLCRGTCTQCIRVWDN